MRTCCCRAHYGISSASTTVRLLSGHSMCHELLPHEAFQSRLASLLQYITHTKYQVHTIRIGRDVLAMEAKELRCISDVAQRGLLRQKQDIVTRSWIRYWCYNCISFPFSRAQRCSRAQFCSMTRSHNARSRTYWNRMQGFLEKNHQTLP